MMKRVLTPVLFLFVLSACSEQEPETISLFNGVDLTGWHMDVPALDDNPDEIKPFLVRDGVLVTLGRPLGHLITDEIFENYRLEIDYRFPGEPGNGGVLIHASTPRALYNMFPQSIEVQMMHENAGDFWVIVEDIHVPDMVERRGPEENWGIREGEARRILKLVDGAESPVGDWNNMVVEVIENSIKVWVNGVFMNHGYDATASRGQIALQAEGAEMEFRKVELTPITEFTES